MQSFRFVIAALALCAASAWATPVTEMRAEDLLFMAPDLKKSLALNPNQERLWLQVEGKTRALLQERRSRRERLQVQVKEALDKPAVELRELSPMLDRESDTSAAEEKQIRMLWLDMYDALDENQRARAVALLAEQLQKVQGDPRQHPGHEGGGEKPRGGRGMKRGS